MPPSAGTPPPRPPRFPLSETAGGAEAKQTIEAALNAMHANGPPFPWQEDDGSALLGCYAPLRCLLFTLRLYTQRCNSLQHSAMSNPTHTSILPSAG